jgi:hypothetical protein
VGLVLLHAFGWFLRYTCEDNILINSADHRTQKTNELNINFQNHFGLEIRVQNQPSWMDLSNYLGFHLKSQNDCGVMEGIMNMNLGKHLCEHEIDQS